MQHTDIEINQACARIARTKMMADKRYKAYYEACVAYDWVTVEKLRLEILSNVESFMDEIAAAHKLLEVERGKTKKR